MTSFSDNFNRADSTNLGAGWVEVSGDWSIISNQLSAGTSGVTILLRAATAMAGNDNFAQVTIAATTSASQGLWCRGDANLDNGYLWRNNGSSWNLFSVVAGAFTSIGSFAAAAAPGDVAKVQAIGSTIKGFVNGVERVSVVNTAVVAGTSVGIRSDSTSLLRYDDFSAGDTATTVTGTASAVFGSLTATASGVPKVLATASAPLGSLSAAASGTPTVRATAAAVLGSLTAAAAGTRKVAGQAVFSASLSAAAPGLRSVIGSASGSLGGLAATGTVASQVTGTASAEFSALTARAQGSVPAVRNPGGGSWYGLLDTLFEAASLARQELDRDPVACLDCGEPLRSGPHGELFCLFDGSIWGPGNRRRYPFTD